MSLYKQFRPDTNVEKTGIILAYGPNSKGLDTTIRVARAGGANAAYAAQAEAKLKPYRNQIKTETMDKKLLNKLLLEVFVMTCVLGWENVELPVLDSAGQPTGEMQDAAFNKENAIRLFTDLPELYNDVYTQATTFALFRAEVNEADSGN